MKKLLLSIFLIATLCGGMVYGDDYSLNGVFHLISLEENLSANSFLITDLADAVNPTDAANLQTVLEHTGVSFNYYLGNTTLDLTLTESESVIQETQNLDPDELSLIFFVALEADTITPFMVPVGTVIVVHFDANLTTTAGRYDTVLYVKLGYVDSGGSSNFVQIGTNSDNTAFLTAAQTSYELHIHVVSEITVPVTKRLYLQVWADSSGSGGFAEINFYFDSVGHHLQFAVGANILEDFVRKSGDTMTGSLTVSPASALTLGTSSSADGAIIYKNASNADTVTIQSGATSGTYTLTLPLAVASAGEVLTDVAGDGVLSWASGGLTGITSAADPDATTALGTGALDSITGGQGLGNTAVGFDAGTAVTSGDFNVLIGQNAGDALTTGDDNVAVGVGALGAGDTDPTNSENVAIGFNALLVSSGGQDNVCIGSQACDALTDADETVAVGRGALGAATDSTGNTAIGYHTLDTLTTAANQNTALGHDAGQSVTSGDDNTLIGFNAGDAITTGSGNTVIGASADVAGAGSANELAIWTGAGALITGDGDTPEVDIAAAVTVNSLVSDAGISGTTGTFSDKMSYGDPSAFTVTLTGFHAANQTQTADITSLPGDNVMVRRLRVYISTDPTASENDQFRLSFYSDDGYTEDDLLWSDFFNLTYSEVLTAQWNSTDTSGDIDTSAGLVKYDLIRMLGGTPENQRVTAITDADTIAFTALVGNHAVDEGVVRVYEYTDAFMLFDDDDSAEIHAKLENFGTFAASASVIIEMEIQ